jgi:hypothetical protein
MGNFGADDSLAAVMATEMPITTTTHIATAMMALTLRARRRLPAISTPDADSVWSTATGCPLVMP